MESNPKPLQHWQGLWDLAPHHLPWAPAAASPLTYFAADVLVPKQQSPFHMFAHAVSSPFRSLLTCHLIKEDFPGHSIWISNSHPIIHPFHVFLHCSYTIWHFGVCVCVCVCVCLFFVYLLWAYAPLSESKPLLYPHYLEPYLVYAQ